MRNDEEHDADACTSVRLRLRLRLRRRTSSSPSGGWYPGSGPREGEWLAGLERAGMFIILGAVFLLPWLGAKLGMDLNVFWWLVGGPASYLMNVVVNMAGIV